MWIIREEDNSLFSIVRLKVSSCRSQEYQKNMKLKKIGFQGYSSKPGEDFESVMERFWPVSINVRERENTKYYAVQYMR